MTAVPALEAIALEVAALRQDVAALRAEVRALHRGREGLDRGREIAIRNAKIRGAHTAALVADLALADQQAGRPARGRGQRIAVDLAGRLSGSQVRRILRALSGTRAALLKTGDKGD